MSVHNRRRRSDTRSRARFVGVIENHFHETAGKKGEIQTDSLGEKKDLPINPSAGRKNLASTRQLSDQWADQNATCKKDSCEISLSRQRISDKDSHTTGRMNESTRITASLDR